MSSQNVFDNTYRLTQIDSILERLEQLPESHSPEIRSIISSIEELKDELGYSEEQAKNYEIRINNLLEVLLKYTLMDFSVQAEVGETGDDLDAISVGVNTLAEELQDRIRTEIENAEKLREQNLKLERNNKELASFAYVSSHDLQEPLRKINTYISRLLDEERAGLSKQGQFFLDRIHKSVVRMQNLIKDILEYSQLTSPTQVPEKVSLTKLAEECSDEFAEELKASGSCVLPGIS